jgi:DMSO/TMAO reductase YedYZ molybdopterin-dependent catalytic subunit
MQTGDRPMRASDRPTTGAADAAGRPPLVVGGDRRLTLSPADLRERATATVTCTLRCASGDRTRATWRGVPLLSLCEAAGVAPETTHLLVTASDGYRACLSLSDLRDGVVAVARDDTDLAAEGGPGRRVVAPALAGERFVKTPVSVEGRRLASDADPSEYERLRRADG